MIDYIYIESITTLRNLKQIDDLSFLAVDNSRGNISVNETKVSIIYSFKCTKWLSTKYKHTGK